MSPFTLVPEVVPLLCQALMAGIAGTFVLSLPRQTRSARWLATLFAGNLIFAVSFMLMTMLLSSAAGQARFNMGLYAGVGVAGLAGVRLSYTFLARPFRREEPLATALAVSALIVLLCLTVYVQVTLEGSLFLPLLYGYGAFLLAATAWAFTVHVRQSLRFRRLAAQRSIRQFERSSAAIAHLAMAGLSALMLALSLINALVTIGMLSPLAIQYGSLLIELMITVGLIVIFINHSPEPTTVQAKLVGVSLGSVLALLGLTSMALLRPLELAEAAGNRIPEEITLRFTPDSEGGYRVDRQRLATFEAASSEDPIPSVDAPVELPFSFPIGGRTYREVGLSSFPYVSFGSPEPCTRLCMGAAVVPGPHHPLALAFVIPSDYDQSSLPVITSTPERFEVTWEIMGLTGQTSQHRAMLQPDGTVEIAYRGPERHPRGGAAGLHLGRSEVVSTTFAWGVPARVPPGAALVDPYGARFVALAQARTLRMVVLVLGATGFVLLMIPLFLRRGVLDPLADLLGAVERIDQGDREVHVPARSNDEFGVLARRFNGMTSSLGAAERRLVEYAESLEDRVAKRTHALRDANAGLAHQRDALARSIAELRDAQSRLVQAENLASLGRLTSGIAHELKNPLNFVTNFSDLSTELTKELAEEIQSAPGRSAADLWPDLEPILEDLASNCVRIGEHGRRADLIVQAMLLHSPQTPGHRMDTDLNALLRLAAEGAARGFAARDEEGSPPRIELDLDPSVGTVSVLPEGVVQVTASLLDNALYAVSHAGTGVRPPVRLRSFRTNGHVEVEVSDQGPGMDAETVGPRLRAVLHDQAAGRGHGARPVAGLRHRDGWPRRRDRRSERAWRGDDVHGSPARSADGARGLWRQRLDALHALALGLFRVRRARAPEREHERHRLRLLLLREHAVPRGHSFLDDALADDAVDVLWRRAVEPERVREVGPDGALALRRRGTRRRWS